MKQRRKKAVNASPQLPPKEKVEEPSEEDSVYDSEVGLEETSGDESEDDDSEEEEEEEEDEFEDQGSSDEDEDLLEDQKQDDDSSEGSVEILDDMMDYEAAPRMWRKKRISTSHDAPNSSSYKTALSSKEQKEQAKWIHTDDLSSDDEDVGNRIGRVPLHWYDEYDHIGYNVDGTKVMKSDKGDRLDQALAREDNKGKTLMVYDALNDRDVPLTERQMELIRRVQAGAYAHPEFDGTPDYIDYVSGVDKEISGLTSNRYEPKSKFIPNKWEKQQVQKLLQQLKEGTITMDYLKGREKRQDPHAPFALWKGDEEDELAMRKGPQHLPAPKQPPPGHAESYIPPDEYLPTEEDLKKWEELDIQNRPHGLMVPKKHPNLRSVGAYQHSVREAFERCLDLYLCPRVMKRRLNIDPESLVPKLPKASDLRPFPTVKCIEYKTPHDDDEDAPMIRCVSPSPDGQFMASGASDGFVRLWEVQTGRLLKSWNVSGIVEQLTGDNGDKNDQEVSWSRVLVGCNGFAHFARQQQEDDKPKQSTCPIVCLEWNPNKAHCCLLAAVGKCVVVIATGTGNGDGAMLTEALLAEASRGGNVTNEKAKKAVTWKPLENTTKEAALSHYTKLSGPVAALVTNKEVTSVRWHRKGDYFVSVSPKAGAAAVLIHQLSKANSQQPFNKTKGGEPQLACFHPNKPFLLVASPQHVRIYHLVQQSMVKRLVSGCRWISSMDIHPTGDHVIVGSLDRRMIWFDLDLGTTPYKTLKYHERALRSVVYHKRYPLMASASDDGVVHVFHSMVYSDLMRNPLVVPVKILKGHTVTSKFGVLTSCFHPTQPWMFTGGADGRIFLYQDI